MIQFYLVFGLLALEFIFLFLLLAPLPDIVNHGLLKLTSKLKMPLRIVLAITVYFAVEATLEMRKEELKALEPATTLDKDMHNKSLRFRAERNFYLCTFTVTLLLIIMRVEALLQKLRSFQRQAEVREQGIKVK